MTKQEFIEKVIKRGFDFDDELIIFENDLDSVIQTAIEEHEAAQWKKYPENKPEKEGAKIIQFQSGIIERDWWDGNSFTTYERKRIIAFRELPKPYQP